MNYVDYFVMNYVDLCCVYLFIKHVFVSVVYINWPLFLYFNDKCDVELASICILSIICILC